MKRIITFAGAALLGLGTLAACSDKVDRDGSIDNFIEGMESIGLEADRACLEDVLDKYDDDELKDFDSELTDALEDGAEPSDEALAFQTELLGCGSPGE